MKNIILNSEMVRATLEDRKTQTRRVLKENPFLNFKGAYLDEHFIWYWKSFDEPTVADICLGKCPYGKVGDRLWVRETFYSDGKKFKTIYAADVGIKNRPFGSGGYLPWSPSIHMPRKFSRITLEITDIRVERNEEGIWEWVIDFKVIKK